MKTLFQTSAAVRSDAGWNLPPGVTELDDEQARLWQGGWEEDTDPATIAETATAEEEPLWEDVFLDYPELLEEIVEILIVTGEIPLEWEFDMFMDSLADDGVWDAFLD